MSEETKAWKCHSEGIKQRSDNHTVHSALAAAAMYLDNCKIDKPKIIIIGTKPFKNIITVPFQCYEREIRFAQIP